MATAVAMEKQTAKYKTIYMADTEWSSHEHYDIMPRLAREALAADDTLDFIKVYEHGGWWLSFNRAGHVVASANDMAKFPDAVRQWWDQFDGAEFVGSIRRETGDA